MSEQNKTLAIIVFTIIYIVLIVTMVILNYMKDVIIKRYKQILKAEKELNNSTLRYCLSHIMRESINNEDYEEARKVKTLLENIPKNEK